MQHKDFVSELPTEISTTVVAPHLSLTAVYQAMQVSRQWHHFFCKDNNDVWQHLVMRHFSITPENMALFKKIVPYQINFYALYECMYRVKQKFDSAQIDLSDGLLLPEMQLQFMACCLDDDAVVRAVVPPDEKPIWTRVALTADAVNTFVYCQEKNNFYPLDKVVEGLDKKRIAIFQFLLTPDHVENTFAGINTVLTTCGQPHIQYLLDHHYPANPADRDNFLFQLVNNKHLSLLFIHDVIIKHNLIGVLSNRNHFNLRCFLRERPDPNEHVFLTLLANNSIYPPYLHYSLAGTLAERNHLDYLKRVLTYSDCSDSTGYHVLVTAAMHHHLTLDFILFLLNMNSRATKPTNEQVLETLFKYNYFDEFLFLLNPDNGYQFNVTQQTLIAAAKSPNVRFVSWLLAHREKYQLQVNSAVLAAAMSTSYCKETIRLLVEQENCVLTEDMLVELISARGYDRYSVAEMDFIMFLLQSEFGMPCSQATFNQMLCKFRWEDKCEDKAYQFVLFFVKSHLKLSLSQSQFETLYTCLYRIADLLDDPDFSHLKPCHQMVKWAIYLGLHNDVTYFLQPYFGLPITLEYLDHAAQYGRINIMRFLLSANPNLQPTQNTISLLLGRGHIALVQEYLEKYIIDINYETLLKDVLNCRPAVQAFGLALAASHHIYPTTNMLGSFFGGNFVCVQRVLDPRYDIDCADHINNNHYYLQDQPACRQLMQSHAAITTALTALSAHDKKLADTEMNKSQNLSRRQFFHVAIYALANPQRYQLDEAAQASLLARVTQALTGFDSFTVIEQREIEQQLQLVQLDSLIENVSSPLRLSCQRKLASSLL